VSEAPYKEPEETYRRWPRDWGVKWSTPFWISAGPDIGLFVGGGIRRQSYGFRRKPYASRQTLRLGYATEAARFRAEYLGDFRRIASETRLLVQARVSGIEVQRFYGFGNETEPQGPDEFHKAEQQQYLFRPSLSLGLAKSLSLRVGPKFKHAFTEETETIRFVNVTSPYGVGRFSQAGLESSLEWDTRDVADAPRRGLNVLVGGSLYPAGLDVLETFGEVHGEVGVAVTGNTPLETTVSVRAGGKRVFGLYPYHEAAFIGGSRRDPAVRGLRGQRYAGDASLFVNTELRFLLGRVSLPLPTNVGVFGLFDAGRVFLEGESSNRWHSGVGGGFWLAPVQRENALRVAIARSEGHTSVYLSVGFPF
jgi:hypothetical protein